MVNKMVRNIIIAIAVIIIIIALVFWLIPAKSEDIVTGDISDVSFIVVCLIDSDKQRAAFHIDDKEKIGQILANLQDGNKEIKKKPDQKQSMQPDFDAELLIRYNDESSDTLYITKQLVVRFLNSQGPDGDPGFIALENDKCYYQIVDYVMPE
ncbi:MAG: hypothetical protein LBB91_08740 [Clostridiales bacterium]|jgi:hypothetical protein|nr:hypothetical protein [Clostridiales bacterium]